MWNVIAYFLVPSAVILLSCFLVTYIFRKVSLRFEQALPIALITISLAMFLLTILFHNITLSVVVTVAAQVVGVAVFVVRDKERKAMLLGFLKTPSLVIFGVLIIALYVINYGRILTGFDDLIHWGPFVTDSLRLNDFYNASTNLAFSVHGDYPPAAALFEIFYVKLTHNAEWLMFVAGQLLCLAMLFPLFSGFVWQKKKVRITVANMAIVMGLIIAGLVSVTLQTDSAFFYEIRTDTLLACVGAYGIYIALTEGKKFHLATIVKLSLLFTFMLLLKQVAVVIAALVAVLYIALLVANTKKGFFKKPERLFSKVNKKIVIVVIVGLILPVLLYKSWSFQVASCINDHICTVQFNAKPLNFLKVPFVLAGHSGTALQQETASHFMNYIYTGTTVISSDTLKLTYPQFILLFCGIMAGLAAYARRKKQRITEVVVAAGVLLVGYFAYLYVLLGTYLYGGFSEREMGILASADRYIGTYILLMILAAIAIFVELWTRTNQRRQRLFTGGAVALLILALVLGPVAYKSIVPYSLLNYTKMYAIQDFKQPIDQAIATIQSDKDFSDKSVVILAECNNESALWESTYLRYHVRPNPYLVLRDDADQQFIRNIDVTDSLPYIDPAGRAENNSPKDISVYVVAMCSGSELEKYNDQQAKLLHFDTTTNIKQKWQVLKTTAEGDYYNTLRQELDNLRAI